MKADAAIYLHVLAFQCPNCEAPVLEWTLSPMRNLESVDAQAFHPKCPCGWTSRSLGAQARGHAVLPWSSSEKLPHEGINEEAAIEPDTGNPV